MGQVAADLELFSYSPRDFTGLVFALGKDFAHAIPIPDKLGWLFALPIVVLPLLILVLAYTPVYFGMHALSSYRSE
jgi:hypothetical protein